MVDELGELVGFDPLEVDLADGHEGADAVDVQLEAALVVARDPPLDQDSLFHLLPGGGLDGPLAGQDQHPLGRVVALDRDLDHVPDGRQRLAGELLGGQQPLALAAHVHEDVLAVDRDHPPLADAGAGTGLGGDCGHVQVHQALQAHATQRLVQLTLQIVVRAGRRAVPASVIVGHHRSSQ